MLVDTKGDKELTEHPMVGGVEVRTVGWLYQMACARILDVTVIRLPELL